MVVGGCRVVGWKLGKVERFAKALYVASLREPWKAWRKHVVHGCRNTSRDPPSQQHLVTKQSINCGYFSLVPQIRLLLVCKNVRAHLPD